MVRASREKKSQKRLQTAQSPIREAKLVILPYGALKKTENRGKKIPKADAAEKQKKNVKNQNRGYRKSIFFKITSVYHAKIGVLGVR